MSRRLNPGQLTARVAPHFLYKRIAIAAMVAALPIAIVVGCGGSGGGGVEPGQQMTTRAQTIVPVPIRPGAPQISPSDVANYGLYGDWQPGSGANQGRKYNLMPAGYHGAANAAKLLSYFSISDIHITDKESPAEALYFGWVAGYHGGGLYSQSYSPVCLSTTQVLDAAVQTINALNQQTPFDFGISLGDAANSNQSNELQWFIDVMDGKPITPSSGDHLGADTIDYQMPFQATGLNPAIPWYEVIGNHDQYWMGIGYPTAKIRAAQVGTAVLDMSPNMLAPMASDGSGLYVGVVDGTSPLGEVIKGGPAAGFQSAPTVAADAGRLAMTTDTSTTTNYIAKFFASTSSPLGHGFDQSHTGNLAACYAFEPKGDLPLKVIVLDDTCKATSLTGGPLFYGSGWIDAERLAWLTDELQKGQDEGKLMIVACHIPINPQKDLFDTTPNPQFYADSLKSDSEMIDILHQYPNLIMLMAGHRHLNTVTPQPSADTAHPENGFWEVETPSLRDFPRHIRTYDIRRNVDNTISILTTDVDPVTVPGTPAAKSLHYAIGAYRLFGNGPSADSSAHTYNAELFKMLTPAMQTKIAGYGTAMAVPKSK